MLGCVAYHPSRNARPPRPSSPGPFVTGCYFPALTSYPLSRFEGRFPDELGPARVGLDFIPHSFLIKSHRFTTKPTTPAAHTKRDAPASESQRVQRHTRLRVVLVFPVPKSFTALPGGATCSTASAGVAPYSYPPAPALCWLPCGGCSRALSYGKLETQSRAPKRVTNDKPAERHGLSPLPP